MGKDSDTDTGYDFDRDNPGLADEDKGYPSRARGGCFVATAVYGDPMAPEVVILRRFRDNTLERYWLGRKFVAAYYKVSPPIADWLRTKPSISETVRSALNHIVHWIQ